MNELIRVNYDSDRPTVNRLVENLEKCSSFTDFFIAVCELKSKYNRDSLKLLLQAVDTFKSKYPRMAVLYLKDCITCEMALPCSNPKNRSYTEKEIQQYIIDNFSYIFSNYDFIDSEVVVNGIGRIDILAQEKTSKRFVIIELKTKCNNPSQQLIAYSSKYNNPILIGITEERLSDEQCIPEVIYYTYKELGIDL